LVERDSSLDLQRVQSLALMLSEPNFSTAESVAAAINREVHGVTARVRDSRRIEVERGPNSDVPALLAQIESLSVEVRRRARVVVNERTGTVVMGRDVRLGAVSILHGSFSIEVNTKFAVSQPEALSRGESKVVPETAIHAEAAESRRIELNEGASVEQLVDGLQRIGANSRDVIAILQAIKAAGALDADLEVI
jgi:flagellar P-ring protein precursor FlgI